MYSLAQRFSRQGISLLTTYESPDLFASERLSDFAISHLADNAVVLNYHRDQTSMGRSVAVIKTRASSHDPATRRFTIGASGISIGDIA
jgi:circadian clock protein KaiC